MEALSNFLHGLVIQSSMRMAVAGDGLGSLDTEDTNRIYARLDGSAGPIIEVHISAIHPNYDDVIYIERENPLRPAGWRMAFWLRDGTDTSLPAPVVGSQYVRQLDEVLLDSDGETLLDSDAEILTE